MKKQDYKIVQEYHDYQGKQYLDLVCYFGNRKFILIPLTKSKKCCSLFYALLKGEVKI